MHTRILALLPLLAACLGACSSAAMFAADARPGAVAAGSARTAAGDDVTSDRAGFGFTDFGLAEFEDTDEDGLPDARRPASGEPTRTDRLLVREALLGVFVANVTQSIDQMNAYVDLLGGYAAGRDDGLLTYRVPAERFEEAMKEARALGRVHHESLQVHDVTDQHRDTTIRLENARKSRDRLVALLEKADDVENVLRIEKELQRLTAEIEAMEAALQNLDLRVAMSLLQIEFSPLPEATWTDGRVKPSRFPWIRAVGVDHVLSRR